jgi:molybdopterin-guanine dinucleotide biosynthesis protein A
VSASPAAARHVDAVILAGGRATRMGGQVKAFLAIDGQTILERQRAVLAPRVDTLAISGDPAQFAGCGLPVVVDELPGLGPLGGLAAALAWCRAPWLLVVAGDMPHLLGDAVELLLALRTDDVDAVAPLVNGLPEPLFALYSRRCRDALARRLAAGRYKASGLLTDEGLRVAWLTEAALRAIDPALRCLHNVNSPTDVAPSRQP